MKTPLLPTQVEDVEHIVNRIDIPNFSEPGTGKTLTTIGCIDRLQLEDGLIVCPSSAPLMWKENLEYELGVKVQWLEHREMEIDKTADFRVATYGVIASHRKALMKLPNAALVIDESQNLKNPDADRTQAIFGPKGDGLGGIYESSEFCWCLSGTPIERYADDIWAQLRTTHPQVLDNFHALTLKQFKMQFCREEERTFGNHTVMTVVANQNEKLLHSILYRHIGAVRRLMKEVDPYMPTATLRYITVKHTETPELRKAMKKKKVEDLIKFLEEESEEAANARRLTGLAKLGGSLEYVMDNVDHNLLIGYWHTEVGRLAYEKLQSNGIPVGFISGATSPKERHAIKNRLINGDITAIVAQIQAAGTAMDGMQHIANHVILLEDEWSGSKVEQFYKRLERKGQRQHVQVDICKSALPIDDALSRIRNKKSTGAKQILDLWT